MRVLFLTTHFNMGGITRYILTLARELSAAGHPVYVVSSGGDGLAELDSLGIGHFEVNIRTKFLLSSKILRAVPQLRRYVLEHEIDIIHAHTRVTQTLAALLSRITGVPYVTTCHGFFKAKWLRRTFPFWGQRVIAISEQVQDHLKKDFRIPDEKIVLARNGIALDQFCPVSPQTKALKKKEHGFQDCLVIGIIARLSPVKGHRLLIHAMEEICSRLPQARLMIVGTGKEEHALSALVRQLQLTKAISFYPSVNQTMEFLQVFDCFVLPSLQEGLGLSVMESQAAGVPVVASRVGGIPSLIEDGVDGLLVEPNRPDLLAGAVIRILQDRVLAEELARRAREKAVQEYGADKMTQKVLDAYHSVTTGVHLMK
ncbi:MAG TPA: glycosyltransferase family 4 protein [Candidatus Bathyarchaeia archaeon]|nr:glycosyltransferase family 4 protein [Candidatus Bathyarchaeia archaeon]